MTEKFEIGDTVKELNYPFRVGTIIEIGAETVLRQFVGLPILKAEIKVDFGDFEYFYNPAYLTKLPKAKS